MRKNVHLNFDWFFTLDFKDDYLKSDFDFKELKKVNIPHTMVELPFNHFSQEDYQTVGTYFKVINLEESDFSSEIVLKFFGVMTKSEIFINGRKVFENEGGYTPFEVLMNEFSIIGDNILIVKVDGHEIKDIPPFGNLVDYLPYSGIYREVVLIKKPKTYIEKLFLSSDEVNVLHPNEMILNLKIVLNKDIDTFKVKLLIKDKGLVVKEHLFEEEIKKEALLYLKVDNIERWDLFNPYLYYIEVQLLDNEEIIDKLDQRFGFRTVMFTENGFVINNKKTKLIGLNRHQSYPYIGYAAPKSMQEMDAMILKDLGCNIVRTSHYMQSDHFINKCDELGLLVFEEIPGWNYIGDENFKALSLRNLEKMIEHHYNHPSICLWGVRINESKDDHDFYTKTNELAKKIDPYRQTGGVRNFKKSELLEDVYTYNDFSHTGDNPGLENPKKVCKKIAPYLVTEYNGHVFPTKSFDNDERRIEHSIRHLNVIEESHFYDNISGAIGWCMADYNTHFQFGSGDMICHHGVLDMHRIEKYAAYAYKSQKSPEQEEVMFVANNMVPGDYDLLKFPEVLVYTNLDYIKVYKNDEYVDTFYKEEDSYLPNPPIVIDDFIGELLEQNERYSKKVARRIKKLLLSYNKHGYAMPWLDKIRFAIMKMRKVMSFEEAMNLYMKYLASQALTPVTFRFEGYRDDKLVKTVHKGSLQKTKMIVLADRLRLEEINTYDMVRVVVKLVDQYDNILPYAKETIKVECTNGLEVVGPKNISLTGGVVGIYLKTIGKSGDYKVKLSFENHEDEVLEFNVINSES